MKRHRVCLVAVGILFSTSASGADFRWGGTALRGLEKIRLQVEAGPGSDAVEMEISLHKRLLREGLEPDPAAPAVLWVEGSETGSAVLVGAVLYQRVRLERDPLLGGHVPTWSVAEAERLRPGETAAGAVARAMERVVGRFLEDWRLENR